MSCNRMLLNMKLPIYYIEGYWGLGDTIHMNLSQTKKKKKEKKKNFSKTRKSHFMMGVLGCSLHEHFHSKLVVKLCMCMSGRYTYNLGSPPLLIHLCPSCVGTGSFWTDFVVPIVNWYNAPHCSSWKEPPPRWRSSLEHSPLMRKVWCSNPSCDRSKS